MSEARLYLQAIEEQIDARRESEERILAILASESATVFGKPVEFEVRWPEGPPMGMDEEQMRQWCVKQVAETRRLRYGPR